MLSLTLSLTLILSSTLSTKANASTALYNETICALSLALEHKPQTKQQTIQLSTTVQMKLTSAVAVDYSMAAIIATNVGCQQLYGASYSGSSAEWAKFFNSATSGLVNAKYKNIQFTLVGDKDKIFTSELAQRYMVKEYLFTAEVGGNKQIIQNLALLDKSNNTLYTFSVSGNEILDSNVRLEFERLLKSIKNSK